MVRNNTMNDKYLLRYLSLVVLFLTIINYLPWKFEIIYCVFVKIAQNSVSFVFDIDSMFSGIQKHFTFHNTQCEITAMTKCTCVKQIF